MRKGFSVIEVLVALILITTALLGMAGSSSLAVRLITEASARRAALHRAQSRISSLESLGCLRASGGSLTSTTISERWTVQGIGAFARVTDTVTWASPTGARRMVLESAFPC
jgi:prepilin-type N-terminal cleavage/methylation domain-containing protein